MPNRVLRDWTDSLRMDRLTPEAERLFVRLIMKADDYGRFHANPKLVKSACFPLCDDLRSETVRQWILELMSAGLVLCYQVNDCSYLAIIRFGQRLRNSHARFPQPAGKATDWQAIDGNLLESAASCGELPEVAGNGRKCPPESESESESETETKASVCAARIGDMKAKFAGWYKRKASLQWDHVEERLMFEAAKRPDFESEWAAIVSYRDNIDDPKYFPSGGKLLEEWQRWVDRGMQSEQPPQQADDFDTANWKP